jgi:hypothetical protein
MFERPKNALGTGSTKVDIDGLTQWAPSTCWPTGLWAWALGGVLEGHLLDRPGDGATARCARDVFEHLSARAAPVCVPRC